MKWHPWPWRVFIQMWSVNGATFSSAATIYWHISCHFANHQIHFHANISGHTILVKTQCVVTIVGWAWAIIIPYNTKFWREKLWWNSSQRRLADNILADATNYNVPTIIILSFIAPKILAGWNHLQQTRQNNSPCNF